MSEPGRTPSAWGLCGDCGSAAPDRDGHQNWHDELTDQLAALEQRLADLEALAARPDIDGGST